MSPFMLKSPKMHKNKPKFNGNTQIQKPTNFFLSVSWCYVILQLLL